MFYLSILLAKEERIAEEDDFTIDILDEDSERLSATVNPLVPTEVRDNSEVNAKEGTRDGLN